MATNSSSNLSKFESHFPPPSQNLNDSGGGGVKPQFNLGGQVSVLHHHSQPQLATSSSNETLHHHDQQQHQNLGNVPPWSLTPRGVDSPPTFTMATPTPKSLNPELLMKEFTQDEQGRMMMMMTDSPSAGFKSSFAKEVVQNVRKTSLIGDSHNDSLTSTGPRSRRGSYLSSNKYRSQFAARAHQSVQDDSDSNEEQQQVLSNKTKVINNPFEPEQQGVVDNDNVSDNSAADLWMTATQFTQFLDKQETAMMEEYNSGNNQRNSVAKKPPVVVSKAKRNSMSAAAFSRIFGSQTNNNDEDGVTAPVSNSSYLDQEALIPFNKLRQTCDDLGFTYSEKEWAQLRQILLRDVNNSSSSSSSNSSKSPSVDDGSDNEPGGDTFMVKNADFFAALHLIMSNKHRRKFNDESHKHSMKSDGGGEMESCRSSDSELERELHEKEREIMERDRELTNCYRGLAERDTELLRVRLECQRLMEDNRHVKQKMTKLKVYSNPKRHAELEKQIEHLKWQLSMMETSRKTYEGATQRLVTFLEQVTSMLQATSPSQRKFVEETRAEVSRVARKAKNSRFSLDSNTVMFRAESMPGLNLQVVQGVPAVSGSLLSLSTTSDSCSTMPRRNSSSCSSSIVARSQSTHSKRSPMPSLQEQADPEVVYVNTEVINQLIQEDIIKEEAEKDTQKRPKSAAGKLISTSNSDKKHVCEIKINDTKKATSPVRRSTSSVLSNAKSKSRVTKLLGIDEGATIVTNNGGDSGRFSLGSRSSSSGRSTPFGGKKEALKKSTAEQLKKEDRTKFKSLGDLHLEKGLPVVPPPSTSNDEDGRIVMAQTAHRLMKSMKSLIAREKTLTITPRKSSSSSKAAVSLIGASSSHKLPGTQKPTLQLLSHTTFPGLPSYPVLAASHSSPWNC